MLANDGIGGVSCVYMFVGKMIVDAIPFQKCYDGVYFVEPCNDFTSFEVRICR